ncbi:UDP-glucose 4-epimerase [Paramagnetospirillum magnetotacticum MS-1]|uniref:UDP-glucose 4-epimerase n=1 Tax=Paramagnetospirillum magnetotacticum MS-1 TaxID=272627 RepID=A0A0C2U8C9_PARME|nr:NAD(P)-dependent oxidoreductase [Paramagnetospirillum magnetotacticum]KIL97757.1 UDP-glucose 4-epimerase [Paramagnetospirillum magnetotacticum MS-1]
MTKSFLLTGGAGHLGSLLARRLADQGHRVFSLVRRGGHALRLEDLGDRITRLEADVSDAASLKAAVEAARPDVVFHLSSSVFNPPPTLATHLSTNVSGAANLIEALEALPRTQIIYASTAAIYGNANRAPEDQAPAPATWLGASKASASLLFAAHARMTGRPITEFRIYTPFGPWERITRLIPQIIFSALDGKPIRTTEGRQTRDYLYADDLIDLLELAVDKPRDGWRAYNAGAGEGVPVRTIVSTVLELMGNPVEGLFGAIPTRPDEIMEMTADISRAKAEFGWQPTTSLREGLTRTVGWFTTNADLARRLT